MNRITNSDIKSALDRLNKALGRATEPYSKELQSAMSAGAGRSNG